MPNATRRWSPVVAVTLVTAVIAIGAWISTTLRMSESENICGRQSC